MLTESKKLRFVRTFVAKLILEVFGGAGAIWGFSEVTKLRHSETQEFWRLWASIVGALFFVRFILQIIDFVKDKENNEKGFKRFLQIFSSKIVLEVFGGAGAIWGASEATTLRRPDTQEHWRKCALAFGCVFFVRFLLQIKGFLKDMNGEVSRNEVDPSWKRFFQIFCSKLVLEVFGGCGAVWGFSEVVTLRHSETEQIYRFIALTSGICFFIRFLLQMKDLFVEMKKSSNYQIPICCRKSPSTQISPELNTSKNERKALRKGSKIVPTTVPAESKALGKKGLKIAPIIVATESKEGKDLECA